MYIYIYIYIYSLERDDKDLRGYQSMNEKNELHKNEVVTHIQLVFG